MAPFFRSLKTLLSHPKALFFANSDPPPHPTFHSLEIFLSHPEDLFFARSEPPPPGERQYLGPHFLGVIRYAVNWTYNNNNNDDDDAATFRNVLAKLSDSMFTGSDKNSEKNIALIPTFLVKTIKVLGVHMLHQYPLNIITPKPVDTVASFIEILVDSLEKLSTSSCSWIIIPSQTNILCSRLKFLNIFLWDTPFQCLEQEESNSILADIESVVNKAGNFFYSFFLTTDCITITAMDLELSILLTTFEMVEEKIKNHCAMISGQPKFTAPNLTSVSICIVDSLLDDLNNLLNHNTDLLVDVKDQLTTLQDELYSCRLMLTDIESPKNKESIKCEIQLIDLAYEADYIISCFTVGEVPVWYLAFRLHSFIKKSNPIRASLTKCKLNSGLTDVRVIEGSSEVCSSQVATKRTPTDEIIVGFEEIRRQIASELIGGPNDLQIITIIGMGGLGKTTLARNLYNDANVRLRFDRRSWCVVSQTYQKGKLLRDILSSLSALNKDEISKMEDHQVVDRVYKSLKRIRYFLVMDDIWKKEVWNDLKRYFPDDRNGSRILFTSRNNDVALQCSSDPIIHVLPLLSTDECWYLLQKIVFPNSFCPRKLQDVGKDIARNCKGLPLAVVGIAAILANIGKKKSLWKEIATNLISYISKDQDILEISYTNLPLHLKPCFLFLGVFEEDKEIAVRELLSLWVSKGLIPRIEHKISEDIAENYLLELINRCMVQVVKRRSDNGVKTFIMHDLIRDMCLRLGDKENFMKVINKKSSTYGQHHHICIHPHSYDFTSRKFGLHIRSLFCGFKDLSSITSSMKCLQVLKLLDDNMVCNGSTLRFLVQLRHLECAGGLYNFESHMNLEFLSIAKPLPRDIQLDMPKLRHLHLGYLYFEKLDITQSPSLQTLSGIPIHNLEDEERLKRLSQLRRLKYKYGGSFDDHHLDLISLTQLVSLNISGNYHVQLKAINFPIHITKLSISTMFLSRKLLSSIGTMPHLEVFKLSFIVFRKDVWNTNDGEFQTLKFLKLSWVRCEEWNTSEDHFPVLEKLVLERCQTLKTIPSDLGYIPTLQRIEVLCCQEDVRNSAENIREEQEEAGNEQLKIIISGAYGDK